MTNKTLSEHYFIQRFRISLRAVSSYATAVVFASLVSCCSDDGNDCRTPPKTTYDLTTADISLMPYTGLDTLYFKDIGGDTNIVVGQGKLFNYYKITAPHGGPDCPPEEKNYQACEIEYKPIKGSLDFTVRVQSYQNLVLVYKSNYAINFCVEWGYIGVASAPQLFNGKEYKNITRMRVKQDDVPVHDPSYILDYNQTNGVLRITNTKLNEEYTILPPP